MFRQNSSRAKMKYLQFYGAFNIRVLFTLVMFALIGAMCFNGAAQAAAVNLPKTGQTSCWDTSGNSIACAGTGQDGDTRSGAVWPNPRFTNPDGSTPISVNVVTDQLTGLMWTRDAGTPTIGSCVGGTMPWQSGLNYVACLNRANYLGYSDWRLPNMVELNSLNSYTSATSPPAVWLNSIGFQNVKTGQYDFYLSSTVVAHRTDKAAYNFIFADGGMCVAVIPGMCFSYNYVWPVRAGQTAHAYISQPWKTGMQTTYDTNNPKRDDGALQMGVAWPSPRFTNPDGSTPVLGDVVVDQLTDLMWIKDASTPTIESCVGGKMPWQSGLNYVACLNRANYLGYSDWRMPNVI
ncbi:secreted protein containing DUF1566 [Candidatus Magnetobacterium bavaricum]|uniref:Secreted protein containing DUF1566 n=1 Tax=Candidatus Magnetobacterium bavaricum TaxID=29290 RepID=A0A0F3GT72_9BACT|nr:secreted protein containing DUF1566 [Candidatus Magnetobacterium bavaricum]